MIPDEVDWATTWAGVSAIATSLTLAVAALAAVIGLRQLRQARELSEEQSRPYVVVYIETNEADRTLMDIVIKNIGQTAARKIKIDIDPPYERAQELAGNAFMDAKLLTQPVPSMPPDFEYRMFFESIQDYQQLDAPRSTYAASVSYEDRHGVRLRDEFTLDIEAMRGSVTTETHGLHHIAKTLRGWAKNDGARNF